MASRGWNEQAGHAPALGLLYTAETGASRNLVAVVVVVAGGRLVAGAAVGHGMHPDIATIHVVKVDQAVTRVNFLDDMDLHQKSAPNQMVLRSLERMRRLWGEGDCGPSLVGWDVAAYIADCMTEEQD